MNLGHLLADRALEHPERPALFVAELPKRPTGKILKQSIDLGPLRERLARAAP